MIPFAAPMMMAAAVAGGGVGAYGNHAYWRVFFVGNHGDSFLSLREVRFKNGSGSLIAATGGTASASSSAGGTSAANAFDGSDGGSNWATASGASANSWIAYQFPAPVGVEKVTITLTGSSWTASPKDCALQYSDDGATWTEAFAFTIDLPVTLSQRTFPEDSPAPGYHRAWRLFIADNDSTSGIMLDELEFRATAGGGDQTANVGAAQNSDLGRIIASGTVGGGNEEWRVFNDTTGTVNYWSAGVSTNAWVGFIFPAPVKVEEIVLVAANNATTTRNPKDISLQYSDDGPSGTTWTTQKTFAAQTGWTTNETRVLSAI